VIELKFIGDAADVRAEMMKLLGPRALPGDVVFDGLDESVTGRTDSTVSETGGATNAPVEMVPGKPARRGRQPKAQTLEGEVTSKTESTQNISTQPENRVDPATAARDKADEAASEQKADAKVFTLEDVRASAKGYIDKWGMEAASADLVPCMMKAVGVGKMSELAAFNDAAKFEAAAKAIDAAVAAGVRYPTEG